MPSNSALSGLSASSAPGPRCAQHPGVPAGWRCDGCGALCPDCVERVQPNSRTEYDTCVRCDTPAWRLLKPGPPRTFDDLLRHHWRGNVSWRLIPILCLVFVWAELTLIIENGQHGVLAIAASGFLAWVAAATFLAVVHDTARGPDEFVRSEAIEVLSGAVRPSVPLALLLFAWLGLPAFAEKAFGVPAHLALRNPLLLVLGSAIGPALAWLGIRSAVRLHGAKAPELSALPRSVFRYGALGGLFMFLFLLASSWALAYGLWLWKSPLLGLWGFAEPMRMAAALTLLILGRTIGFVLHAHAPELGFPLPDCYQVPVLPEAIPSGKRATSAPPRDYSPIEI